MFTARTSDGRPVPTFDMQGITGKDWWVYHFAPMIGLETRGLRYLLRKVGVHYRITEESLKRVPFAVRLMDGRVFELLSPDGDHAPL